jgi:adenylate cyclase
MRTSAPVRRDPGDGLAGRLRRRLTVAGLAASLAGALVVFVFDSTVFGPGRPHADAATFVSIAYVAVGLPFWVLWQRRRHAGMWRWIDEPRAPDAVERDLTLRAPLRWTVPAAALWGGAALVLAAVEMASSLHDALEIGLTVLLGGVTTSTLTYLVAERTFRPAIRRALAGGAPERAVGPGVGARLVMAWVLATACRSWGSARWPAPRCWAT